MPTPLDWQTQETRLNNSLYSSAGQTGENSHASKALFNLYLSMQMPNVASHNMEHASAIELPDNDEKQYPGIELSSAPKSSLYAKDSDYQRHILNVERLANTSQQNLASAIQWQNAFFPQPLHYASEQVLIDEAVLENTSFYTQHLHQAHEKENIQATNSYAQSTENSPPDDLFSLIQASQDYAF